MDYILEYIQLYLESVLVELAARVLVRAPVALGVRVVPQAAAEAHSEPDERSSRLYINTNMFVRVYSKG